MRSDLPQPFMSRADAIVIELRNRILGGNFTPGYHLQEVLLAEQLGVSRTPVREALVTLAKEGLLEPGPKRGHKVRTFSLDEILNAYDVRAALEALAVRLIAEKGLSDDARIVLEECLEKGDMLLAQGLSAKHQSEWLEMNNAFHTAIVTAAQNEMLTNFVNQSHRIPLASSRHVHWYELDKKNFDTARKAHEAHHDIFDAIVSRSSARAESLMREHILFSQRLIKQHFASPEMVKNKRDNSQFLI